MTSWYPRWYRTTETPFAHSLDSALARELHHAALLHAEPDHEVDLPRVLHAADAATASVVENDGCGWVDVAAMTEALEYLLASSQRGKANGVTCSSSTSERHPTNTVPTIPSASRDYWIATWTKTLSCGSRPTTPLNPTPGATGSPRTPPPSTSFSKGSLGSNGDGGVMGAIRYWTTASSTAVGVTAATSQDDVAYALLAPTPAHLALVWLSVLLAARRVAVAHARALLPLHSALQLCLSYWQWTLDHPYYATAYELISLNSRTWSHLWIGGAGHSAAVRDRISKVTELRLMEKSVVRQIGRLFQSLELLQRSLRFLNVQRMMEESYAVVGFAAAPRQPAVVETATTGYPAATDESVDPSPAQLQQQQPGGMASGGTLREDEAPLPHPPRAATPPALRDALRSGDDDPQGAFAADVASAVILAVRQMVPRAQRHLTRYRRKPRDDDDDGSVRAGGGDDTVSGRGPTTTRDDLCESPSVILRAAAAATSVGQGRTAGDGTYFSSVPRVFSMTALHPDTTVSSFFPLHDDAEGDTRHNSDSAPLGVSSSTASSPESALHVVRTLTSLSRSTSAWVERWRDLAVSRFTPPVGRHWRRMALATCIALPLLRAFFTVNSQDLQQRAQAAVTWIDYFLRWYVVGPALNLHRALFAPRVGVQERQEALRREVESMAQIIEDYHRDFALRAQALSSVPADLLEVHRPNAREGDYGLIQQHLEEAIRHPIRGFFFGNLVRLSLIHVQQLKLDVSRVLASFDEVLEANDVNFRVMALGPFVLCSVLLVSYVVFRKKEKRRPAFVKLRLLWRTLHRLLSLSGDDEVLHKHQHQHHHHHHHHHHHPHNGRSESASRPQGTSGGVGIRSDDDDDDDDERDSNEMRTTTSGGVSGMTDEDQGRVALTVHQMRGLKEFLEDYQLMHEFLEDLDDLDMPHLTRGQRLRVLDRMHAIHHFLDANAH